jgi:hypothetical protein
LQVEVPKPTETPVVENNEPVEEEDQELDLSSMEGVKCRAPHLNPGWDAKFGFRHFMSSSVLFFTSNLHFNFIQNVKVIFMLVYLIIQFTVMF